MILQECLVVVAMNRDGYLKEQKATVQGRIPQRTKSYGTDDMVWYFNPSNAEATFVHV